MFMYSYINIYQLCLILFANEYKKKKKHLQTVIEVIIYQPCDNKDEEEYFFNQYVEEENKWNPSNIMKAGLEFSIREEAIFLNILMNYLFGNVALKV